jgi:hypothetical protein
MSPDDIAKRSTRRSPKKKDQNLEAEKKKRKTAAPTRKDEFGLRAQAISGALAATAGKLEITPKQMIEAAKFVELANGHPVKAQLARDFRHAEAIMKWLDRFLQLEKGL